MPAEQATTAIVSLFCAMLIGMSCHVPHADRQRIFSDLKNFPVSDFMKVEN